MVKKNKGAIKTGQKDRADNNNEKAIRKLLAEANAAKKEWLEKPAEWRKANPFILDPLLGVARITAWPSSEWFTIVAPNGDAIQVRGLDKAVSHTASQLCKRCKQTQAGSDTWPMVVVSLPKLGASSKTGEILAILDPAEVSQFADLGFKVTGVADADGLFDDGDNVDIDAI